MRLGPRTWTVLVLLGLVAVAAAAVLATYPTVSDARDLVEDRWSELEPQLDERYRTLAELSDTVRGLRPDLAILEELGAATAAWSDAEERGVDGGPPLANRLESLGARLVLIVAETPSLRREGEARAGVNAYLETRPPALAPFNDAVESYDGVRSRFPGRFFTRLLGFEGVGSVEPPAAADRVQLPLAPRDSPDGSAGGAADGAADGAQGGSPDGSPDGSAGGEAGESEGDAPADPAGGAAEG